MIEYITKGDILEDTSEALVNPVNCVGVMGAGLALKIKKKYPDNFLKYYAVCKAENLYISKLLICKLQTTKNPKYIINFPTKFHFRHASRIEYIDSALVNLSYQVRRLKINSVALPALGCGLGGLPWYDVQKLINKRLAILKNIKINVYLPQNK